MTTTAAVQVDHPVVRFDAELLIHRAGLPVGCAGAVLVTVPLARWDNPANGRRRIVERCHLPSGHPGEHTADDEQGQTHRAVATACGLPVHDGAWIDWQPSSDDPRCPACHGEPSDDGQDVLL